MRWKTTSSWYFGSSHPLYFDMLCRHSILRRFKLIVKPDLSDASLHVINPSQLTPRKFEDVHTQSYRICEDTLVFCWTDDAYEFECGVYTLTFAHSANVTSHGGPTFKMLLPYIGPDYRYFSCPASGRFVGLDSSKNVVVHDFF